jgi:hypothetical protein
MRLTFQTWIIAFALSFAPAFAQEVKPIAPRDKVAKILDLQFSQPAFMAIIENSVPQFINAVRLKNPALTPTQIKEITEIYKQAQIDIRAVNRDATIDGWIETYSEQEIEALYKFYTSTLGAAIAAKQAALAQNTQSKTRMISQTIFAPDLARRLKSDPLLKDLAF